MTRPRGIYEAVRVLEWNQNFSMLEGVEEGLERGAGQSQVVKWLVVVVFGSGVESAWVAAVY